MKYLLITFSFLLIQCHFANAQHTIKHRVYDTEFGRFDLWIYGEQLSGTYEIAPKNIIGSVLAELDEFTATGRWTDPDGTGEIIITFENDFQAFSADYRNDQEPENWYRDQWHGVLKKAENQALCSGGSYDLITPFIGTWEEYELNEANEEDYIGTLNVRLAAGGCSLVQRFVSPDSSFFYTTQGYVNKGSGIWEEKYVFSTGATADYQWIIDQGDIVQRRIGGSRKINYLHQLRFTELDESGYLLLQENSLDGGRTWKVTGRTRVKRK